MLLDAVRSSQFTAFCTFQVWSNSSGHEHAPPTHIVMKNQAWPYREHVRVELLKGDDTMAYYELVATDGGEEESFNFTGDGNRCNIV